MDNSLLILPLVLVHSKHFNDVTKKLLLEITNNVRINSELAVIME